MSATSRTQSARRPGGRVASGGVRDAGAVAEWNSKKWVWVPDAKEGYVAGWVVKEEGDSSVVSLQSGDEMRTVPTVDLSRVNPPIYDGAEDIAELTYLNEGSVVHNLKTRYSNGDIYTYSGLFLVAINPYRPLSIYTPAIIEQYKHSRRDENAPHVFAVAQQAWQNMVAHREQSQSVLVTGESGAGKTENTKKVIQFLAAIAADPLPTSASFDQLSAAAQNFDSSIGKKLGHLERQILQANPILESFGNAQTIKNNNSSRFGKFVRIFFDPVGAIAGATIDWYLLEKSRVTARSPLERNFHVFFQLLHGADAQTKTQLLLTGNASDYEYLKHSKCEVGGMDDKLEWGLMKDALDTVGFTTDEQLDLFRVLSAILNLGNIVVGGDRSDQAFIKDQSQLEKVAFLLGITNASDLLNALVRPKVKAGREWVVQARTTKQVVDELAALAKSLYEKNFGSMVTRINKALGRPSTKTFIGVLDIAGFEIFEVNGFEQLCINLTNEKLQQFFNHHMFVLEQEEYAREEIDWSFVNFGLELQPTIDLIESSSPVGILACLDDACIMPKATDAIFTSKMHELAKAKPIATPYTKYTASRFELGFKVSHYAGEVEYRTDGWLDKNRDPLSDPLTSLLAKSSDPYIASLFAEFVDPDPSVVVEGPRLRIKRGAYRTVGQFHRERLAALMAQLRETQPHFVRCIVPNLEKSPTRLDTPLILDQLRCNGVLEGIRIARLGYPNRLPFSDFRRRFELITPGVVANGFVDGAQACRLVLAALEVDPLTYKIGLSKVFFKAGILADLEERRDGHLSAVFTKVQAACRKFIARRAANKILNRAAAVRTIQRNARIYGQLRAWPWWALFQRVRPLLAAARSDDEARRKEAEMVEIKEKAERDEVERARLQKVQEDLEAAQAELEASLVSERALSIERESLLRLSKEREAALEEDLALAQADLETVDGQLERAMASKAEADQRIGDLNSAFANSTQLLATLQMEQAAWKAREVDLASKTSIQTSEWDRVNSEREAGVVAIAELRRNVAEQAQDAEREHKRLVDALAAVEGRLATTSKELVDVRAKLSKLETDSRAVKEESTGLESQRKSLEAQLKERSSELTRVQAAGVQLTKERDAATSKATDLSDKLASTTTSLADVKRQLETAQTSDARSTADLKALKAVMESNVSDHQQQVGLNKIKDAELEQLRLALSKASSDLAISERTATTDRARLQREVDAATTEASTLKTRNADLSTKASAASTRIAALEASTLDQERRRKEHDVEVELVRTRAAEAALQERSRAEKELSTMRAEFGRLEDAALHAQREKEAVERDVVALQILYESEQATSKARLSDRKTLDAKIEQQHLVLADFDKINGNLRSELAATKARLRVAEDKASRNVVEHIRVLEDAQRLQNAEMDRMRHDRELRDAYVRTLERQRVALTASLEDLQHEKEAERREAWANRPGPDQTTARLTDALSSETKLRQEAELNVTRLRQEVQLQLRELEKASRDLMDLRRVNIQIEREMNSLAASDHTQSMALPSTRDARPLADRILPTPPQQHYAQTLPTQTAVRRRNYE